MFLPLSPENTNDNEVLTIQSFQFDVITEVGVDLHAESCAQKSAIAQMALRREQYLSGQHKVEGLPEQYCTRKQREDAYWKTLSANRNRLQRLPQTRMKKSFDAWQKVNRLGGYAENRPTNGEILKALKLVPPFFSALHNFLWQRLFFITQKRRMGITAGGVKQGDVVSLVYGTSVPFLLRPLGKDSDKRRFTIVGEAYVHGLIDSESMRDLENDRGFDLHIE